MNTQKTPLQELIEAADRLCNNLDIASQNEKKFCDNICMRLEQFSWEAFKMSNELKEIKEYCGNN